VATLLEEIEAQITGVRKTASKQNVGVIIEIGDGVAKIEGLTDAMLNEMIDLGNGIIGLAYLTTFGSLLAYTSYVYALKKLPVTNMSMYAYINPLVAVLLGWFILHEQLTWVSIVAMCIVLSGVALVQTGGRRSNRTVEIQVAHEESAA